MYIFQIFLFYISIFECSFPPAPPSENRSALKELKDLFLPDCSACLDVSSQSVFSEHPLRKKKSVDLFTKSPNNFSWWLSVQTRRGLIQRFPKITELLVLSEKQRPATLQRNYISASWIFNCVLVAITQNPWSQWKVKVKAIKTALLYSSAPHSPLCFETKPGVLLWMCLNFCLFLPSLGSYYWICAWIWHWSRQLCVIYL